MAVLFDMLIMLYNHLKEVFFFLLTFCIDHFAGVKSLHGNIVAVYFQHAFGTRRTFTVYCETYISHNMWGNKYLVEAAIPLGVETIENTRKQSL